jgi:dehydrogenase/reductase SDR family member 1
MRNETVGPRRLRLRRSPVVGKSREEGKNMAQLEGKIALVTGGSRGVGKGVVQGLTEAGATVYFTARTARQTTPAPPQVTPLRCDHRKDEDVEAAFRHLLATHPRLDILVNNVWGGYERMVEDGEFTWPYPFWRQPRWRWDAMFQSGVRACYVASQLAARLMVGQRSGLIVNLSFWAAQKYLGNTAYGAAKAATDKLTADMAHELRPHNVAVVSLYPGLVRTEAVLAAAGAFDLRNSESPQFIGRAVAALAADPDVRQKTGRIVIAAALAREYGFTDVDGRQPRPLTLEEV